MTEIYLFHRDLPTKPRKIIAIGIAITSGIQSFKLPKPFGFGIKLNTATQAENGTRKTSNSHNSYLANFLVNQNTNAEGTAR